MSSRAAASKPAVSGRQLQDRAGAQVRYSSVAIALHWTIAALIIFELNLGSIMVSFPLSIRFLLVRTHATAGLLVLLLSVPRVLWRLTHRPPAFAADTAAREQALAHAGTARCTS